VEIKKKQKVLDNLKMDTQDMEYEINKVVE
jgi:hypothetical protein